MVMGRFGSAVSFREGCVSGRPFESEQGAFQNVPRCASRRVQVRFGSDGDSDGSCVERPQNRPKPQETKPQTLNPNA